MNHTSEHRVEAFLADLQRATAGLVPWDGERFRHRRCELDVDLRRCGLDGFVSELLDDADVPSASAAFLDLEADEPGRRASHQAWVQTATERLPALWAWLRDCLARGGGQPWWVGQMALRPADDTVETLRRASATPASIAPIAEAWAAQGGLARGTAEHNWRWLALGRHLTVSLPAFPDLLRALVRDFRDRDLLPANHRVELVRRPNRPSMVLPVRLPGHSALMSPSAMSPLTVQYLQHELAHLSEHALRPADAPLRERWRFDPVRSEGWALLFEHLLHDPRWLRRLGFAAGDADHIAAFLAQEEAFSRGLIAADLTLGQRLGELSGADDALAEAAGLARALGIHWAPAIMMFRQPAALQWRSYIAGWAWRDAALDVLGSRFGSGWRDDAQAWRALRAAIATTGSASDALQSLTTEG